MALGSATKHTYLEEMNLQEASHHASSKTKSTANCCYNHKNQKLESTSLVLAKSTTTSLQIKIRRLKATTNYDDDDEQRNIAVNNCSSA